MAPVCQYDGSTGSRPGSTGGGKDTQTNAKGATALR